VQCMSCQACMFQQGHSTPSSRDLSAWFAFVTNWLLTQLQLLYTPHKAAQGEYSQHSAIVCVSQRFVSMCLLCMTGCYHDGAKLQHVLLQQHSAKRWCNSIGRATAVKCTPTCTPFPAQLAQHLLLQAAPCALLQAALRSQPWPAARLPLCPVKSEQDDRMVRC